MTEEQEKKYRRAVRRDCLEALFCRCNQFAGNYSRDLPPDDKWIAVSEIYKIADQLCQMALGEPVD